MKKKDFLFMGLVCITLFSASGCKKIIDEIIKNPNGVASDCRIEKIETKYVELPSYGQPQLPQDDSITFEYDTRGNPLAIRHTLNEWFNQVRATYLNNYFRYYPDGRLGLFLEAGKEYEKDGETEVYAVRWHKFIYHSATLVEDSIFTYANGPADINFSPLNSNAQRGFFILDNYGRVIKEGTNPDGEGGVTYSYDANGNLIVPGVTYNTSKTNIRQTHKTWMFLTRNYSVNPANGEATTFNSNKLPTKPNSLPPLFFTEIYPDLATLENTKVTYRCK